MIFTNSIIRIDAFYNMYFILLFIDNGKVFFLFFFSCFTHNVLIFVSHRYNIKCSSPSRKMYSDLNVKKKNNSCKFYSCNVSFIGHILYYIIRYARGACPLFGFRNIRRDSFIANTDCLTEFIY